MKILFGVLLLLAAPWVWSHPLGHGYAGSIRGPVSFRGYPAIEVYQRLPDGWILIRQRNYSPYRGYLPIKPRRFHGHRGRYDWHRSGKHRWKQEHRRFVEPRNHRYRTVRPGWRPWPLTRSPNHHY